MNRLLSKIRNIDHWRIICIGLMAFDVLAANFSYLAALWIRFDLKFTEIPDYYLDSFIEFAPYYSVLVLLTFAVFKLYRSIWRFASYHELILTLMATFVTFVIHTVGITAFVYRMPISYYMIGITLQFMLTLGIRFSYRLILLMRGRRVEESHLKRVMVIGAGAAGQMLIRDIVSDNHNREDKVCCIIDDNHNKWHRFIEGIEVVGGREDILYMVDKYDIQKIYFAIPSAKTEDKREILNICNEAGCEIKALPGIYQLRIGEVSVKAMKDVSVEDLLGREPITVNMNEVYEFINDKVILVTGGGGSIGSELCRQVAAHGPRQLIIFDIYENNAYDIQLELKKKYPDLNFVTLIGSVRDSRRMNQVFETYHPDIVYHAAAHKHVPLMEDSPCESIKNNVIGTYKTAYAALTHGCSRFVLISTDKAVNPTNIMGASKRLCEMVVQSFDRMVREGRANEIPTLFTNSRDYESSMEAKTADLSEAHTEFVAVRFGNVLGSNGSVIPLFRKQIAAGGPVTVTHPDIIRYFMTVPEAVSLVMQAGTYAHGGEIFVLDMGKPVKIDTLARNLIKLSGFKPDVDIKIEYTGLRPGEKLYEEKLMNEEGMKKTPNELIYIGSPIEFDTNYFLGNMEGLMEAAYSNSDNIREVVMGLVSTYRPAGAHGSEHKDKAYYRELNKEPVIQ